MIKRLMKDVCGGVQYQYVYLQCFSTGSSEGRNKGVFVGNQFFMREWRNIHFKRMHKGQVNMIF